MPPLLLSREIEAQWESLALLDQRDQRFVKEEGFVKCLGFVKCSIARSWGFLGGRLR